MTTEELLETPYWIVDILPEQVPEGSPGRYFAVEQYFRQEDRLAAIRQKHINVILKLSCYRKISLDGQTGEDLSPESIAEEMRKRHVCVMLDDSMIVSEPDDTYVTVYHPDRKLLELIRTIAAGEGLHVWQPPSKEDG